MQFSIDLLMQFYQTFYEVFKTYIMQLYQIISRNLNQKFINAIQFIFLSNFMLNFS